MALLAGALVSCRDDPAPAPPLPRPASSPTASSSAAATLTVRFDGKDIEVGVGPVPRRLADIMPEGGRDPAKWRELAAWGDGARTLVLRRYGESYADYEARLYLDDKGRPSIGVFRPILPDTPAHLHKQLQKPHVALIAATRVEVRTAEIDEAAPSPAQELSVTLDAIEQTVDPSKLAALPRRDPPQAQPRAQGQRSMALRDVVALFTALEEVAHVKLVGADDDLLVVRGEALRNAEIPALLRYNRRGQLSFSLWEKAGGEPRRLRGVVKLIIASKDT